MRSRRTRTAFARIVAEKQIAKLMPGIMTLSSSCPACAPQATAVSLPMTWKQTWLTISGIAGLTLPGMIDEPGCTAGIEISPNPVRGPETSSRMSLQMLEISIAAVRMPLEMRTNGAIDCIAAKRFFDGTIGSPYHSASSPQTRPRNFGSTFSAVPAALPPIPSSQSSARPARRREAAPRMRSAHPENS